MASSSPSAGQVHIGSALAGERLRFHWAEGRGAVAGEPTRRSFGTRMPTSLGR